MKKVIKIGSVGLGRLGYEHAKNIATSIPGAQLTAICDIDAQRVKDVAAEFDVAYTYTNFEEMCANPELDAIVIVSLPDPTSVTKRAAAAIHTPLMTDWKDRFIEAYDIEFQEWAKSLLNGAPTGPSAWDGYVACVTGEALIRSRQTGKPEDIVLPEKPAMYQ